MARGLLMGPRVMTHDALFKLAFEAPASAAALFRALLPPAIRGIIAWETVRREPGSFVDPGLREHFNDLLYSVRLRVAHAAPVFLLLEHQSTEDRAMPQRALSYQVRLWDRLRRERRAPSREVEDAREANQQWLAPVIAVVISHVPGGWSSPRALEHMFDPVLRGIPELGALLPRFSLRVEDLSHRSDDDLRAGSLGAFQQLALWLLRDARASAALLNSFDAWVPTMLRVARDPAGNEMLRALFTYMFRVIQPEHLDGLRAKLRWLGRRTEDTAMTIANTALTIADYLHEEGRIEGRQEGRIEGRQEGRIEGRQEGRIDTLRSLLRVKFRLAVLDEAYEARLRAATPEMLDGLVPRVLAADTLAAVFDGTAPPFGGAAGRGAPTVDG